MSQDVAFAAVRFGMKGVSSSGLLFYGGEPLLERQLIYDTVEYASKIKKKTGHNFFYKMTTNGTLLDEEFLEFAKSVNLTIGFSHDGPVQDDCRLFANGEGSFELLEEKIPLLLKYQPYAIAMCVTDPSTVHRAAEMIKFMFDKGFRYLHISHNYDRKAPWTQEHLAVLEREYKKMAEMYIEWTRKEIKFYLSPVDAKILSHLKGEKYNADRLRMACNQPSVNYDGKIYYSSKYLGNTDFEIGDVFSGINSKKQKHIYERAAIPGKQCLECAIRTRCNYAYDSLVCEGGEITADITPMQCAHEQVITPVADYAAQTLYKDENPLFIHKHYNEMYPVMSLVEDMSK
jgi:uncharacterized protein